MALHEACAVPGGDDPEVAGCVPPSILSALSGSVIAIPCRAFGGRADEGEDPSAVLSVFRVRSASEASIVEDREVVPGAIAAGLGACRTAGGGPPGQGAGVFDAGEVERH